MRRASHGKFLLLELLLALGLVHASPLIGQQSAVANLLDHPALQTAEYERAAADWWQSFEQDPDGALAPAWLQRIAEYYDALPQGLAPTRLLAMMDRVRDAEASYVLRVLYREELERRMFTDAPLSYDGDLFPEFARQWKLLGPVGHLHEPDPLRVRYAPEYALKPSYAEAPGLAWTTILRGRLSPTVAANRHIVPQRGAWYLLTQFVSTQKEKLTLEVFARGAYQVYWNGESIATVEDRRHPVATRQRFAVRGMPGVNALMIKLDGRRPLTVGARLLDREGRARNGEHSQERNASFSWRHAVPDRPAAHLPARVSDRLERAVANDPLAPLLVAWWHARRSRVDRALAELAGVTPGEISPALIFRLRHDFLQRAAHLPREFRRRQIERCESQLDSLQAASPAIERTRIRRQLGEDQFELALAGAEALAERFPAWIGAVNLLAEVMAHNPMFGALARTVLEESQAPANSETHRRMALLDLRAGDVNRGLDRLRLALSLDGRDSDSRSSLFPLWIGGEDQERHRAAEWIERWRTTFPGSNEARSIWRELLRREARHAELLADLEREAAQTPARLQVWRRLAIESLRQNGDFRDADNALERWGEIRPADPERHRLIARFQPEQDQAERFFAEFNPDKERSLALRQGAGRAGAIAGTSSTALLLDSALVYLFADGSGLTRTQMMTLALNRTGTEALHEEPARPLPLTVRVLDREGTIFEPVLVNRSWVMPSLDPGDVVELEYDTYHAVTPGAAPDPGWFRFQSFEESYLVSRYGVFVPDDLDIDLREFRFDGEREVVPWENGTVYLFTVYDQSAFPDEALRPPDGQLLPWVQFGRDDDLLHIGRQLRAGSESLTRLPADFVKRWRQLDAGRGSELERAQNLYAAVQARVRDFQGNLDAVQVWTERRGLPIFLYAAILEAHGIAFEWAFAKPYSPELDPGTMEAYERGNQWGVALLRLEDHNRPVWVTMTGRGAGFGQLPENLAGAETLVLGDEGVRLENLPRAYRDQSWTQDYSAEFLVQEDGSAQIRGELRLATYEGTALRAQLEGVESRRRDALATQILGQLLPGFRVESHRFPDLDVAGAPLRILFEGQLSNFLRRNESGASFRMPLPPMPLSQQFGPSDRITDLHLPMLLRTRSRVRVQLPEDLRAGADAIDQSLEREGFLYRLQSSNEVEDQVVFERILTLEGLRIPLMEVPPFLSRLRQLDLMQGRMVEVERR